MMKRAVWFVSGAAAGIAGANYAKRKVKETATQLTPVNVAKSATNKARQKGHDVVDAIREGREAKRNREAELWAKLAPADEGDSGEVFVTSEVREVREVRGREQVGPRRSSRRSRRGP